jgi:hypothetical protein
MANNVFGINSNEIEAAQSSFSNSANQTSDAIQAAMSGLQPALGCGIATNSMGTISRQMNAISNSMTTVGQTLNTQANEMFDYDATMAAKAEDIEVPNDFMADNQTKISEYNKSLLEKLDGRSVNDGGFAEPEYKDAGTTVESETVRDIDHASADLSYVDKNQDLSPESQIVRDIDHASADLSNADKNQGISVNSETVKDIDHASADLANVDKNEGISVASQQVRDIDHASADLTSADKNQTTVIGSSILGNIDNAAVNVEHIEDASNIERSMIQNFSATEANMTDLEKNGESIIGDSVLGNMNSVNAEGFSVSASNKEQKTDDASYIEVKKES